MDLKKYKLGDVGKIITGKTLQQIIQIIMEERFLF